MIHGLVIRAMLESHARLAAMQTLPERLGKTSVCVVAAEAPHPADLVNCIRHLASGAIDREGGLSA